MREEEHAAQRQRQQGKPYVYRCAPRIVLNSQRVSQRYLFEISQYDLVPVDQQRILSTVLPRLLVCLGQILFSKLGVESKCHRSLAVGSGDLKLGRRIVVVSRQSRWS